jgi:hypothetical protein
MWWSAKKKWGDRKERSRGAPMNGLQTALAPFLRFHSQHNAAGHLPDIQPLHSAPRFRRIGHSEPTVRNEVPSRNWNVFFWRENIFGKITKRCNIVVPGSNLGWETSKALCYKPVIRFFHYRCGYCIFLIYIIHPASLWPWGPLSL